MKKVSVRRTNALFFRSVPVFPKIDQMKKAASNQLEDNLKIVWVDIYVFGKDYDNRFT